MANEHQTKAWNGYEGEHWAARRTRYDAMLADLNAKLFPAAAITAGERVLDVGCGAGETTRIAASSSRHATGIDLSGPMLEQARAASADLANVTFIQGDAQVYPFPRHEFDIAISRGGIMYFEDPVAAFSNIRRALRPAGRVAFIAGGAQKPDSDSMAAFTTLSRFIPRPAREPGDNSPSPAALSDPDRIREIFTAAGFHAITVQTHETVSIVGADAVDATDFILTWGPVRYALEQAEVDDTGEIHAAMTEALRPFETDDGVRWRSDVVLITATAE
ncbi:class I SAM-dependent methyltransferase [Kibdelosporangium persicum]|uniref:Cyclopropane-fatty-acyl-phospholipid synthase n=1 Tax=Kibdelosporangium persicum TaxID=2698649 RepID=A0ABX2F1H2_9PSEU|nr:class I SAM-dependent methyltransferase [Kibdelosporangium persicum]NRN64979.1 Cyclopropane-fatty-acyl-phospholipid synthase [Kibdelosporangium persicum]